jgi:Polysaccharide pyruvyl transferase
VTVRVLLTGWFSFIHGEVTAGDVLVLDAVSSALRSAGICYDTAWSPVFRSGGLRLEDASPEQYTHLIFACGPVHGEQVAALHSRFASCRRIAVGVTVIDRTHPEVTGFDLVLARDGPGSAPLRDLAVAAPSAAWSKPVTGVILATGQGEYGERRRHEVVNSQLTGWLAAKDCAPVPMDTRLDSSDWRLCSTARAFMSLVSRLDVVVTTRLHGLVLALQAGVPALAVDPVEGGGKVTAQAIAWDWPCVLAAGDIAEKARLDQQWDWCLSAGGRVAATLVSRPVSAYQHPLIMAMIAGIKALDPVFPVPP